LGEQTCVEEMRQAFERRKNLVVAMAKQIEGLKMNSPMGAFYVFPDCKAFFGKKTPEGKTINDSSDLTMYLLETAHVACVGGDSFGAPDCIRMSYATSDEKLKVAFERIAAALAALK